MAAAETDLRLLICILTGKLYSLLHSTHHCYTYITIIARYFTICFTARIAANTRYRACTFVTSSRMLVMCKFWA